MRRIINSTYISLDGVVENLQDWPSGRHQDDGRGGEIQTELSSASRGRTDLRTPAGQRPGGRVPRTATLAYGRDRP
jgi:hypothetical protein